MTNEFFDVAGRGNYYRFSNGPQQVAREHLEGDDTAKRYAQSVLREDRGERINSIVRENLDGSTTVIEEANAPWPGH